MQSFANVAYNPLLLFVSLGLPDVRQRRQAWLRHHSAINTAAEEATFKLSTVPAPGMERSTSARSIQVSDNPVASAPMSSAHRAGGGVANTDVPR